MHSSIPVFILVVVAVTHICEIDAAKAYPAHLELASRKGPQQSAMEKPKMNNRKVSHDTPTSAVPAAVAGGVVLQQSNSDAPQSVANNSHHETANENLNSLNMEEGVAAADNSTKPDKKKHHHPRRPKKTIARNAAHRASQDHSGNHRSDSAHANATHDNPADNGAAASAHPNAHDHTANNGSDASAFHSSQDHTSSNHGSEAVSVVVHPVWNATRKEIMYVDEHGNEWLSYPTLIKNQDAIIDSLRPPRTQWLGYVFLALLIVMIAVSCINAICFEPSRMEKAAAAAREKLAAAAPKPILNSSDAEDSPRNVLADHEESDRLLPDPVIGDSARTSHT